MAYHIIEYNLLPVNQLDALSVNTFDFLQGGQKNKGWFPSIHINLDLYLDMEYIGLLIATTRSLS